MAGGGAPRIVVMLALAVSSACAEERYGLSPDRPLELRASAGDPAVLLALPPHGLYFAVLEEAPEGDGWYRIASLPCVVPPYRGWVPLAGVEVFGTVREARLRYFATHPLRAEADRFAAVLQGGYWDLRDQGAETESRPDLWLRYGFDLAEWYIARGKMYEAEIRDIADIVSVDERLLVLTVFIASTTTPAEPLEIEILGPNQIRLRQAGGTMLRFGRSPPRSQ